MNDLLIAFRTPGPFELFVFAIIALVPILIMLIVAKFIIRNKRKRKQLRQKIAELEDQLYQSPKGTSSPEDKSDK